MSMNRHKCKLCTKIFSNGKALGGHMRSHLLPLPPSKRTRHQLNESSASSSSNSQLLQQQKEAKRELEKDGATTCALTRENPKKKKTKTKTKKKSANATDPEFLYAGSSVVQEDRASKSTETAPNPSRKQLDRTDQSQGKEVQITSESVTESVHLSCVSDGSPDEEVARCLMMLSMDKWVRLKDEKLSDSRNDRSSQALKPDTSHSKPSRAKYKCLFCRKNFRSQKALCGHKATGKMCRDKNAGEASASAEDQKIYECQFCFKVFGSGQALGGHKRSHLFGPSSSAAAAEAAATRRDSLSSHIVVEVGTCLIDLNSPAPVEDDDFSVVSDDPQTN